MNKMILMTSMGLILSLNTAWASNGTEPKQSAVSNDIPAKVIAAQKSQNKTDVFSSSKKDVFSQSKPDVFSKSKPDVFSKPKAELCVQSKKETS